MLDTVESRESTTPFERAQKGSIWVIADGFGPRDDALHASRLAARIVIEHYWNSAISNPGARLRTAINDANHMLRDTREDGAPTSGATISPTHPHRRHRYVAHIGRARGYHSPAAATSDRSPMTIPGSPGMAAGRLIQGRGRDALETSLTRALGIERQIKVDMFHQPRNRRRGLHHARQRRRGATDRRLRSRRHSIPPPNPIPPDWLVSSPDNEATPIAPASSSSTHPEHRSANESTGERRNVLQARDARCRRVARSRCHDRLGHAGTPWPCWAENMPPSSSATTGGGRCSTKPGSSC
ncbi:MAG: hypothetical protein R2849_13765 [Thermomicrobiales bacterium]